MCAIRILYFSEKMNRMETSGKFENIIKLRRCHLQFKKFDGQY